MSSAEKSSTEIVKVVHFFSHKKLSHGRQITSLRSESGSLKFSEFFCLMYFFPEVSFLSFDILIPSNFDRFSWTIVGWSNLNYLRFSELLTIVFKATFVLSFESMNSMFM